MPFKSEAQRRWMHANKPEMAKEWEKKTPKGKDLPDKKDGDKKDDKSDKEKKSALDTLVLRKLYGTN